MSTQPTEIQSTDCIGASRVTINENFETLYKDLTAVEDLLGLASADKVGVVCIGDGLSYSTEQGKLSSLTVSVDNETIKIVENKLVAQSFIHTVTATYQSGSGVVFVATDPTTESEVNTINVNTDSTTIKFNANHAIMVDVDTVASLMTLPSATDVRFGTVKLGDGVTTNGDKLTLNLDTSSLGFDSFGRVYAKPTLPPPPPRGIMQFIKPGDTKWVVPPGVSWVKLYACSGGAGDNGSTTATGFATIVRIQGEIVLQLEGGISGSSTAITLNEERASGIVIPGSTTDDYANTGFNFFYNLRVNNLGALSNIGKLPGAAGDSKSSTGSGGVIMCKVYESEVLNITVGAGGGIETPGVQGLVVIEY